MDFADEINVISGSDSQKPTVDFRLPNRVKHRVDEWPLRFVEDVGGTMSQIIMDIPVDTLLALKVLPEQAAAEIKMAAAVKLFELGRLSSGAAARLVGVPRTVFLSRLADYGVETFRLTEAQLQHEAALVRSHLQHIAASIFAPIERQTGWTYSRDFARVGTAGGFALSIDGLSALRSIATGR